MNKNARGLPPAGTPVAAATSRRAFLRAGAGFALAGLAGCAAGPRSTESFRTPAAAYQPVEQQSPILPPSAGSYGRIYSSLVDGGYVIPAIPFQQVDPIYYRQIVADPTGERPGSIVVDTNNHFLYLVRENGEALRYGVGLGRAGFAWQGRAIVQYKRKWPRWTPPDEMVARQPELEPYSIENGGMDPGLDNPLGARALYIFQNGVDTLYRVHGSPEWWSIGKSVSSGCVRMFNQDVIDLYDRVPNKTPILVTDRLPPIARPQVA